MSYTAEQITAIFRKYITDEPLAAEEQSALAEWSAASADNQRLLDDLSNADLLSNDLRVYERLLVNQEKNRGRLPVAQYVSTRSANKIPARFGWLRYAAVAILLAGAALLVYRINQQKSGENGTSTAQQTTKRPAIMLTLADGSEINLDENNNGKIAAEQQADIFLNNNSLIYNGKTTAATSAGYNTINIPRGRQLQIVLPDGTKVWLNAGSSFKYPLAFSGNRRVDLQGEAFFEVKKDAAHPLSVHTGITTVNVLGTSFNVSAYENDNSIHTTVLDGLVQTLHGHSAALVKPGHQSRITKGESNFIVQPTDAEGISSWRKGLFYFHDRKLPDVMRDIERWYDITIIYPATIPDIRLEGKLSRSLPLAELIRFLEGAGLHLTLRNDKTLQILAE